MDACNIEDGYFPSADSTEISQTKVIYENNVSPQFVQDMVAFWDSNSNGILETGEGQLFTYKIKIFISREASYLKEAFDKFNADPSDVCFFLEDNSTDIFSDRTAYIKIGTLFQSNLKDRKTIALIETKSDFFGRYKSSDINGESYTLDFSEKEITELIQTGKISNPAMSVVIGLYQLLNLQNIILAPVYSILSDGLLWITATAREYIEFKDKHWDPEASDSGGANFKPVLFSTLSNLQELGIEAVNDVTGAIKKGIDEQEATLKAKLSILLNPAVKDYVGPDSLNQFVEKCLNYISELKANLYNGIDTIVSVFAYIGEKWLNALNAFYCGLWNAIVEIFLGLIDLVAYVFLALAKIGEAAANAQSLVPQMLELLDEFVQMILKTDIINIIFSALEKIMEKVLSFNLYSLTNSVSIERVAYFLGNIAGFIVELIIGAFVSGGTKSVVDLFKKFGTVGEDILQVIMTNAKKLFGSGTGISIESITRCIQFFIDLVGKGKEEVLKWIDEFFELLEMAAKLGNDILKKIEDIFNFTAEQIEQLKKTGLDFVTYVDDAAETVCSLCRITTN